MYSEALEASQGARHTPGSLNLVEEAGQTKKEIKSIYELLHRLFSTIALWQHLLSLQPTVGGQILKLIKKVNDFLYYPYQLVFRIDKDTLKKPVGPPDLFYGHFFEHGAPCWGQI